MRYYAGQGFSPAGVCLCYVGQRFPDPSCLTTGSLAKIRRKPKGLPYAGDSNVGQGFSLADSNVGQGFSPADARSNVGQGFSLAGANVVGPGFSPANMKFKKRIRLREFDYKGPYRYFVTLCTYNKQNVFRDKSLVSCLLDSLREKSKTFRFRVWAYCFMPDHLHVLIEGNDGTSDLRKFVSSFKQDSGFRYKKEFGHRLWQTNYYEHVLRKEEDTDAVAKYIFNNPVRKGIVEDYRKYALLGSFEFDVSQT